ncbi:EamA family transporter [Geodermatophilus sp. URMC 61]|uniref:EamA family transporter n=1 Tax=Geodermatophilus sp. URMC 61 TaxID=3423411 RepID=UPI00406CE286
MAVLLALASAVVYGAADFCGGLATRRATASAVVALSQLAGLAGALALLPVVGGAPTGTDLAWGAAAGLAGATGLVLFYRALAEGVMSVVAPVTAVSAAALPVLGGLLLGERIGPWTVAGILLALVAVVLVAAEDGLGSLRTARPTTLLPALAAGSGFGLFFVLLDRTGEDAALSPLVAARVASVLAVVLVARLASRPLSVPRGALPVVMLVGIADMAANALFLLAAQQGQLAVTGILASLYPVSTVVLAQVVLRERLVATQAAGLAAAGAAVVLIALPT